MDYEAFKTQLLACRLCETRFGFAPHPVVFGNPAAKIMQISQAPSQTVHRTLRPFSDASGRRLRGQWYHISDDAFYNPLHFYITSVAHCFPGKTPSGGDRPPPKLCAKTWLAREMALVHNQIYIVIGKNAADILFPKLPFGQLVFQNQRLNGRPAYVLPHPSPLNVKWFKDNPAFENGRIQQVAAVVHRVLGLQ